MKKFICFISCIGLVALTMYLLPNPSDSNKPGAGDIWWMNVSEINEAYHKVSTYK